MIEEELFQNALERAERDHSARFLLSQWLEQRGDHRYLGYLWECRTGTGPQDYRATHTWDWNDGAIFGRMTGAIPHHLFIRLRDGHLASTNHYREYAARVEAEEALCRAIVRPVPANADEIEGEI